MSDVTEPAPAAGRRVWPNALPTGLVVAFAFLAASFTARNSDLWRHMAAGRLVAEGTYPFGTDPFAEPVTAGTNHAWLADFALYEVHRVAGGGGLVALKAALVGLTALMLLRTSRSLGPRWLPAAITLLAVLAMAPGFGLRPRCASLFFLAVCLGLLRHGKWAHLALPVVIALWANVDEWFVLGPLLVVLVAIGSRLSPDPLVPRPPGWLVLASLVAGLATPDHVRGLRLPAELSPATWTSDLARDPRFAASFASPWHVGPLGSAGGYNLAAWAFWVLVALGLVSFAMKRRSAIGWRGLAWLAFVALALWQVRLVPFFAVVAGPVTALNFGEVEPARTFARAGRVLVTVAALILCGLCWPGWVEGFWGRDRGLAWAAMPDRGLTSAAELVGRWRADGTLPAGTRVIPTHPPLADYLLWLVPGEHVVIDDRLDRPAAAVAEFEEWSRSVGLVPGPPGSPPPAARVLVYDPDSHRMTAALQTIAAPDGPWELVAVAGGVAVVRPKGAPVMATKSAFDPGRLAFGPPDSDGPPVAPGDGCELSGGPEPPWLVRHIPRRASGEADAAFVYLRVFEITAGRARSPALPLLAARACRIAVAAGPGDAAAWVTLARAYLFQSRTTWEAEAGRGFPLLAHLRQAQVAAALVQAAAADPDSAAGHESLANLFAERGFIDQATVHRREQVRLARRAGPAAGEAASAFAERIQHLTAALTEMENALQDAENRYLVRTAGSAGDPLARARVAAGLGLVGRAIDVLAGSNADLYGPDGLRLLLDLLTWTGRAADVRALLDRDEIRRRPERLGVHRIAGGAWAYMLPAYDWFDLCQAACAGRYSEAGAALDRMRELFAAQEQGERRRAVPRAAFVAISQAGLPAGPGAGWALPGIARERNELDVYLASVEFLAAERADLHVIGGLLDLERGTIDAAAGQFAAAGERYAKAPAAPARPGKELAERYAAAIRAAGK